ncbi:RagB/SusD family nutrient uptake outer membrane protein [Myroides albus]|uniref:RagB/SusD family nutrient uptake outer membrane protein n=1 Tax=Myroides albus TaxID=2562892 RepID=UPI002158C388|nr:RagB/SusD family nutrient uptake outer membrane protein [Myroides albus]UVD79118.1 RagB/SusD family nutrient uptake outer membrane protein [Myroides albus]
MTNIKHAVKSKVNIFLILLITLSTSCTELVEVDLPDTKIDKSEVFKDASTIKAALNNLYLNYLSSSLFNKANTGINFNISLFTDELDYYGSNAASNDIYLNTITDTHSTINNWWNNSYQHIYVINAFIEGVEKTDVLQEKQKNTYLGEAYTLRALYYQYLAIFFGDIPYTKSTDYKLNKNLVRTPYTQVILNIEEDLKIASNLLDYTYRDTNKFYANKAVADLLLIENYLLQNRYDKAEQIAQALIDTNIYNIEIDLQTTFKKNAKSTLWQLSPRSLVGNSATSEALLYIYSNFTTNSSTISDALLNLFDEQDKRKNNWLNKITLDNQDFYQVYKYKNQNNNTDEFSIIFRIEQIYFDLVFSFIMQDKIDKAIDTLNILRQKRGLDNLPVSLNKQELIDYYLQESSKEFFTENARRFIDLKLTNKLEVLQNTKPSFKSHHNLLPIPIKQIEINKNLLPNNPGY